MKKDPGPKGAGYHFNATALIPNISFVVLDLIALQELTKFLVERFSSVMLRLVRDVFQNVIKIGLAHRKHAISALPVKIGELRTFVLIHFEVPVFASSTISLMLRVRERESTIWI